MADGENNAPEGIVSDISGEKSFSGSTPEFDPFRKAELHERPDNIPEKFWDAEKGQLNTDALLKSYSDLEKQFSSANESAGAVVDDEEGEPSGSAKEEAKEETTEEKPEGSDDSSKETPAALTGALEAARTAYAETGELSAEVRAPFLAAGISDAQIDLYLQGVKAQEAGLKQAALKAAGVDDYAAIEAAIAWASANWSPKKIDAFNLQANDVETIGGAVKVLFNDYREANPSEGKLLAVHGGTNRGDVYGSRDEYSVDLEKADAMSNPAERRLARNAAVEKMRRSLRAKSIK